ncbi:hypothetical protein DFH07DRAFT_540231 [Mycena maculata]|uniref:MYND-type domain-containing protein n=1 Tax=Mycena maculata TaxID=230809 RepID=A0AAD7K5M4_9AGAR|nr:hypothetical protein DFH07DRAFT_540231 [Mycena maculata]
MSDPTRSMLFENRRAPFLHPKNHPKIRFSGNNVHLFHSPPRLPIGLQTQAKAGLPGSSHSDQALRRLCDLSTATERMHSKSFLPVFYAALDIVYIPTTGQLEAYMDGTNPGLRLVISSACWAITGVATLAGMGIVDPRALLELWSRIWPWIEFLHGYWEHLPAIDNFPEGSAYTLFVSVILALSRTTMKEAISHTHGVRAVLGRAWLVIIQAIPSDDAEWLANISEVLGSLEPSNIQTFQELVEGVGGTMAGLACIIVKHFDRVVHPHSPISTIFPCTWGVFILLDVCRKYDPDDCLPDHLVSNGAISSLITLLRALADASLQQAAMELMDHSFAVLCRILAGRRSHFKIMEGFRAGLIPMMKVTALKNIPRFDVYLENILLAILPSNMVYRSVLMELQESLPILEDLGTDRASGSIKDAWRVFTSLAKARLQLLRDYEAGKFLSSQGCDNLECGIIRAKSTFRRCSGCRTLCYCSRKCQIEDWRAGHRQACEHFLNLKLGMPSPSSSAPGTDHSFVHLSTIITTATERKYGPRN